MELKSLRKQKGLTQEEVAKFLQVAISTYRGYENYTSEPTIDTLCRLADFYGVSLDYICNHKSNSFELANLNEEDKKAILTFLTFNEMQKQYIRAQIKTINDFKQVN